MPTREIPVRLAREARIPALAIAVPATHLFNKSRFSGVELGTKIGITPNTLWTWFYRRGVPVSVARRAADVLVGWAAELLAFSMTLREQADLAESPPTAVSDTGPAPESLPAPAAPSPT